MCMCLSACLSLSRSLLSSVMLVASTHCYFSKVYDLFHMIGSKDSRSLFSTYHPSTMLLITKIQYEFIRELTLFTYLLAFKFSVHGMIMRASSWKRQLAVPWTMKEREGPAAAGI